MRGYSGASYGSFGLTTDGGYVWTNIYPASPSKTSSGKAVTITPCGEVCITGYSPGSITSNDIVTIAYDTGGKQLWLQRYDGSAHGDDAGNAIAADNHGNVYVAGYETVPGGGTEMVLIKYAPVTIQKQGANMLLQAQGSSGEPFHIQASTNLQAWLDLGTNHADTKRPPPIPRHQRIHLPLALLPRHPPMKNLSQELTERTEKRRDLPPFPLLPPVKNLFRLLSLLP